MSKGMRAGIVLATIAATSIGGAVAQAQDSMVEHRLSDALRCGGMIEHACARPTDYIRYRSDGSVPWPDESFNREMQGRETWRMPVRVNTNADDPADGTTQGPGESKFDSSMYRDTQPGAVPVPISAHHRSAETRVPVRPAGMSVHVDVARLAVSGMPSHSRGLAPLGFTDWLETRDMCVPDLTSDCRSESSGGPKNTVETIVEYSVTPDGTVAILTDDMGRVTYAGVTSPPDDAYGTERAFGDNAGAEANGSCSDPVDCVSEAYSIDYGGAHGIAGMSDVTVVNWSDRSNVSNEGQDHPDEAAWSKGVGGGIHDGVGYNGDGAEADDTFGPGGVYADRLRDSSTEGNDCTGSDQGDVPAATR